MKIVITKSGLLEYCIIPSLCIERVRNISAEANFSAILNYRQVSCDCPFEGIILQQLNSKNIRKIAVLSLHGPISGTQWFLTNVA
jgi:hypothetical protein